MSDSVKPWDLLNPNTVYISRNEYDLRMNICNDCDRFIRITKQCKECGCFMKVKAKMKAAVCPIGKW